MSIITPLLFPSEVRRDKEEGWTEPTQNIWLPTVTVDLPGLHRWSRCHQNQCTTIGGTTVLGAVARDSTSRTLEMNPFVRCTPSTRRQESPEPSDHSTLKPTPGGQFGCCFHLCLLLNVNKKNELNVVNCQRLLLCVVQRVLQ